MGKKDGIKSKKNANMKCVNWLNKTTTLFVLIVCSCVSTAQSMDDTVLVNDITINSIKSKLDCYGKVVLYNSSGYWNENLSLKGIGYGNDKYYRLELKYKRLDGDLVEFKSIKRRKISNTSIVDETYFCLTSFNLDSLNLKIDTKTNVMLSVSDGEAYSILYFDSTSTLFKYSYMPRFYQERVYTSDRDKFIKLFDKLLTFW